MKQFIEIENVFAREIFDSRGNPTVEAEVIVEGGYLGRASVPSGASTGQYEAVELRDLEPTRLKGLGVKNAVHNVNKIIAPKLIGKNVLNQMEIDNLIIDIDGTEQKEKLGANAMLAVSLAVAHAAAEALGLGLYQYLGGVHADTLPLPMMNIINGGKHADNNVNIQEFMIVPMNPKTFAEAMEMCVTVFNELRCVLKSKFLGTTVGDEGGFAPNLESDEAAIETIIEAIEAAGFVPGKDFKIALDVAATEMYEMAKGKELDCDYHFWKTGECKSTDEMINYLEQLVNKYPIFSIEDGMAEEDWEGWKKLTERIGDKVHLVGDDLFVTNVRRLKKGIDNDIANAILVKVNQIGTLTETLEAIEMAHKAGYKAIVSHRSGETEDVSIADLAVACNCGLIKTGAPSRTDRVAKYNQLLRIEEEINM